MTKLEVPQLFTPETVVFANGIEQCDLSVPITVFRDSNGNHALADGNHRAYRAFTEGKLNNLGRVEIGKIKKDVSSDPDYRLIADLRVILK